MVVKGGSQAGGAQTGGRKQEGRKSKWGRHCCRPHSHLRVVAWFMSAFGLGKPPLLRCVPERTWHPVYRPRPAAPSLASPLQDQRLSVPLCFAVLPPTLAPASGFALCLAFAPVVAKATTLASSLPLGIAETVT